MQDSRLFQASAALTAWTASTRTRLHRGLPRICSRSGELHCGGGVYTIRPEPGLDQQRGGPDPEVLLHGPPEERKGNALRNPKHKKKKNITETPTQQLGVPSQTLPFC